MIRDDPDIARIAANLRSSLMRMAERWTNINESWVETRVSALDRCVVLRHENIDWGDVRITYHMLSNHWHLMASAPRGAVPDYVEFQGCREELVKDAAIFRLMMSG